MSAIPSPKPLSLYVSFEEATTSGLLPLERVAEILAAMARDTSKCFDNKGLEVKNAYLITKNGERWLQLHSDSDYMNELHQRDHFASYLTQEEIKLLNDRANAIRRERAEQARFEKAEKIEGGAWNGWVVDGDNYHSSVEDWIDRWLDRYEDGDPIPLFIWAAEPVTVVPSLDVADVVESWIEANGWEDCNIDDFDGVATLQAALDAFVAANSGVVSYQENPKKAILVADLCREALKESQS